MPTNLIVSNFWSMNITPMWFSALVGRKIAIFELLDSYSPTLPAGKVWVNVIPKLSSLGLKIPEKVVFVCPQPH